MGTPFKMRSGNSPLKESEDWFNVRGYLKGEQGLIPDYKGKSTVETATDVSKAIQKGHGKVKKVVKKVLNTKKNKNNKIETNADAKMMKVAKPLEKKIETLIELPSKPIQLIPTSKTDSPLRPRNRYNS